MNTTTVIMAVITLLLTSSVLIPRNTIATEKSPEFLSIENKNTGLKWRFYHSVKGTRYLPEGFCQNPENGGGNNWRLPIRREFEILIADPEFGFPPNLAAKYFSREVRDLFGHPLSMRALVSHMELGQDEIELSDSLVFDLDKKKWKWEFLTDEHSVACVSP